VHALQPEPRPSGPIAEVLTGLANQLDGRGGHPPRPVSRIGGDQSLNAAAPPPLPPPPNRPSTEPVVAARGAWPVRLRVLQNEQAIPHPRPILRPNLHVAQLDHGPPWCGQPGRLLPIKAKAVNLSRYFTTCSFRLTIPPKTRYAQPHQRGLLCEGSNIGVFSLKTTQGAFFLQTNRTFTQHLFSDWG